MFAETHFISNFFLSSEPIADCSVVIERIRDDYFSIKFPLGTTSFFEETQFISFHPSDDMMRIIVKPETKPDDIAAWIYPRYCVNDKRISETAFESEIPVDLLARLLATDQLVSARRNIGSFAAEFQDNADGTTHICVLLDRNA